MIRYAVIDTNVLISALLTSKNDVATVQVLEKVLSGEIVPDMKDLPFYEAVLEKSDDEAHLVTGNIKHYPKEHFIVTPRELMELMTS